MFFCVSSDSQRSAVLSVSAAWTRRQGEGKPAPFSSLCTFNVDAGKCYLCHTCLCCILRLVVSTLRSKRTSPWTSATLMRRLKRSERAFHNLWLFILLFCPTNIFSIFLFDRDTARLIIRKIQYAPSQVGAGPKAEICKSFMMSDKPVHLEAAMEKDVQ